MRILEHNPLFMMAKPDYWHVYLESHNRLKPEAKSMTGDRRNVFRDGRWQSQVKAVVSHLLERYKRVEDAAIPEGEEEDDDDVEKAEDEDLSMSWSRRALDDTMRRKAAYDFIWELIGPSNSKSSR